MEAREMRSNKVMVRLRTRPFDEERLEKVDAKLQMAEVDLAAYLEGGATALRCRCVWELNGSLFYSCLACAVAGVREPAPEYVADAVAATGTDGPRTVAARPYSHRYYTGKLGTQMFGLGRQSRDSA